MATRAAHERSTHIDKEGKLFGIICDREDCQEKLPNSKEFRRHMIDKHRKNNYSLVKKESFCCDLCGKVFKVCKYLLHIFVICTTESINCEFRFFFITIFETTQGPFKFYVSKEVGGWG